MPRFYPHMRAAIEARDGEATRKGLHDGEAFNRAAEWLRLNFHGLDPQRLHTAVARLLDERDDLRRRLDAAEALMNQNIVKRKKPV